MTMNEQLRFFADNGYVVIGGALTAAEVAAVNAGIDADRAAPGRPETTGRLHETGAARGRGAAC